MKKIGDLGEQLIGRWLQLQNYELLEHNWRCRWGEIDLIAQNKSTKAIAFVEVKTRSYKNWDENGLLAIDYKKQEKILQAASLFLAKFPNLADLPCRFDVGLVSYRSCNQEIHVSAALQEINCLKIGQTITLNHYQITIEHYLQAAFE